MDADIEPELVDVLDLLLETVDDKVLITEYDVVTVLLTVDVIELDEEIEGELLFDFVADCDGLIEPELLVVAEIDELIVLETVDVLLTVDDSVDRLEDVDVPDPVTLDEPLSVADDEEDAVPLELAVTVVLEDDDADPVAV